MNFVICDYLYVKGQLQTICDAVDDSNSAIAICQKGSNWSKHLSHALVNHICSSWTRARRPDTPFWRTSTGGAGKSAHEVPQETPSYMVILNHRL